MGVFQRNIDLVYMQKEGGKEWSKLSGSVHTFYWACFISSVLQLSVTMMSWVRVWVDLRFFTTQFFDKVLLDTWREWEWNKFWEEFGDFSANKIKTSEYVG